MLVILGSGHAGYSLAREWRKLDAATPLTIVTRDDGASYYKPDLSKAFAAGKDAAALIKADAAAMAQELNAKVLPFTEVTGLDVEGKAVLVGERRIPFTQLVLALGASPIRLPLGGEAADQVQSVNDRLDYARLRERLTPGCRVLILGAGLIGCEFANDLAAAGFGVTVNDVAEWPLARFVPEVQGRALEDALRGIGVDWRLGTSAASVDASPGGITVRFADGSALETEVVLSAVGLRPQTELARTAGIVCGTGIVVDVHLRTSAPDVYALGDCVELGGRSLPFILPIGHAARALAPTLAGTPTAAKFPAMPTPVKTPVCPAVVCPPPPIDGRWEVTGDAPDLEAVFFDASGAPRGFALTGKATARRGALGTLLPALELPEAPVPSP